MLIARLRSHQEGRDPEEFTWKFDDYQEALGAHATWTAGMARGLWDFRDFGGHWIKPGALVELDLRTMEEGA